MIRGDFRSKRGQVTLFVILAVVVISVIIVIFAFPQVNVLSSDVNPSSYLRNCISPEVQNVKNVLSDQGGYSDPFNYANYKGVKLQYLCYTSDFYTPCSVQQPLLLKHIQNEIRSYIEPRAKQCFEDFKSQYEKRGYSVSSGNSAINVSISPETISIDFIAPLTITKDSTQKFQKFSVAMNSKWYYLINTATNIIQYESTYGDSDTSLYISYYPSLIIGKTRRDDGSTIYQLSDASTGDKFDFATRSLVWPQGLR
jgi:hypothetical protein